MSLLEQITTRKKQVNKNNIIKLNVSNNSKNYKIEAICDCVVYAKKSKSNYLLELYYLVFWKDYLEKKNTRELTLPI